MKIVSWNCAGAFRRKCERIASLGADVFVIQECENPALSTAEYRDWAQNYVWIESTRDKGIGVFVKNGLTIEALDWPDHGLEKFLPVRISNGIKIVAVWTKAARRMGYIGQFWQYLNHHAERFDRDTIICGDLNSNTIWDKVGRTWNHSSCVEALQELGFRSCYHVINGQPQGKELQPTFYLHRNPDKPYHIDYIFAHHLRDGLHSAEYEVGQPADWLTLSDHMPVSLTV